MLSSFLAADPDKLDRLMQLGVGGAVAVVLIWLTFRFVLEYSRQRKAEALATPTMPAIVTATNGNGSGAKPVEYWQQQFRQITEDVVERDVVPLLRDILAELRKRRR